MKLAKITIPQPLLAIILASSSLLRTVPVAANFIVYRANYPKWADVEYMLFDSPSSCDWVSKVYWYASYPAADDVSGDKVGVRCAGACGMGDDPAGIDILEMNFNGKDPVYHWSLLSLFLFSPLCSISSNL